MARKQPIKLWKNRDFSSHRKVITRSIENLTVDAISILGILWSCRPHTPRELSQVLFIPERTVRSILSAINKSREPAILDALAGRFPIAAIVEIPTSGRVDEKRLICKRCQQVLSKVPCCKCLLDSLHFDPKKKLKRIKGRLPQSLDATRAMPGTAEKMEVMRLRAEAGFSVFCRRDARIFVRSSKART